MTTSNLNGPTWERAKGGDVPRKHLKPISAYSTDLPKGVVLRRFPIEKTYVLTHGQRELGRRYEEVVKQWERPERVFAFLARTWLDGRRFPDEAGKTTQKD